MEALLPSGRGRKARILAKQLPGRDSFWLGFAGDVHQAGQHVGLLGAGNRIAIVQDITGNAGNSEAMHAGVLVFDLGPAVGALQMVQGFTGGAIWMITSAC